MNTTTRIPLDTLREQIAGAIAATVKAYNVPDVCVHLGIQAEVGDGDEQEAFRSKRMYVKDRILEWSESDLLALAAWVLMSTRPKTCRTRSAR